MQAKCPPSRRIDFRLRNAHRLRLLFPKNLFQGCRIEHSIQTTNIHKVKPRFPRSNKIRLIIAVASEMHSTFRPTLHSSSTLTRNLNLHRLTCRKARLESFAQKYRRKKECRHLLACRKKGEVEIEDARATTGIQRKKEIRSNLRTKGRERIFFENICNSRAPCHKAPLRSSIGK